MTHGEVAARRLAFGRALVAEMWERIPECPRRQPGGTGVLFSAFTDLARFVEKTWAEYLSDPHEVKLKVLKRTFAFLEGCFRDKLGLVEHMEGVYAVICFTRAIPSERVRELFQFAGPKTLKWAKIYG